MGSWYNESGRVGISAVRVVIVWALSIVVSSGLIEITLFMGKLYASCSNFLISFKNQTQVTT